MRPIPSVNTQNNARAGAAAVRLTTISLVGLIYCGALHAFEDVQQKTLVTVGQISLSADMSMAKAQHLALNEARAKAIERAGGIAIISGTLIRDSLMAGSFVETLAHGYIIEERILGWESDWRAALDPQSPPIPLLKVRLKSTVELPPQGFLRRDILHAHLEKPVYTAGDTAQLTISADDDMHILIANYTIDDDIVPLYPNQFDTDNVLLKGTTVAIPDRSAGYDIQLTTNPDHQRHTEAFLVFGFPYDPTRPPPAWTTLFPPGQALDYADFHRRLTKLPVHWMAEQVLVYEVSAP